jgi:hypothetical protein
MDNVEPKEGDRVCLVEAESSIGAWRVFKQSLYNKGLGVVPLPHGQENKFGAKGIIVSLEKVLALYPQD